MFRDLSSNAVQFFSIFIMCLLYLFVVEEGNRVTRRYVETGVKDSEYTSIISGLNEGEVVVCDLGAADYENQKINPVSDKKE